MLALPPITATMSVLGIIVMGTAYIIIGLRLHESPPATLRAVQYLRMYFLNMVFFLTCLTIPYIWLGNSGQFSLAMAWGYVVGHVFCYLAFLYIARMVCVLVPWLNRYEKAVIVIWLAFTVAITIINAQTMIWGIQPVYDYTNNLIQFRAAPIVGAGIAIIALASFLPAAILFGLNAVKSHGERRLKSALLFVGLIIVMLAGPLHDVARTGMVYALADVVSIIGIVVFGSGIMYRLKQQGLPGQPEQPAPPMTPAVPSGAKYIDKNMNKL